MSEVSLRASERLTRRSKASFAELCGGVKPRIFFEVLGLLGILGGIVMKKLGLVLVLGVCLVLLVGSFTSCGEKETTPSSPSAEVEEDEQIAR